MAGVDPSESFQVEWHTWPDVPEKQRPKRLPHAGAIDKDAVEILRTKGWEPIDVRLLPNASDAERGSALKATLEGIRFGTIACEASMQKFLDLEARSLGLTSNRAPADDKPQEDVDKSSLRSIFGEIVEKPPALYRPVKKTGRPPGSKTKKEEEIS